MDLKIKTTRRITTRTVVVAFLMIMLVSTTQVKALDYHFTEDFSELDLSTWSLIALDFKSDTVENITSTFEVKNNELVSLGELEDYDKWNHATINNTNHYGAWRFKAFNPELTDLRESYRFAFHNKSLDVNGSEIRDGYFYPRSTLFASFSDSNIDVWYPGYGSARSSGVKPVAVQEVNTWRQYDVILTPEKLIIYIDNYLSAELLVPDYLDLDPLYFSLGTAVGSNVRFDDLQVTSDYEGVIQEIESNPPQEAKSNDDDTKTGILLFPLIAGGSA